MLFEIEEYNDILHKHTHRLSGILVLPTMIKSIDDDFAFMTEC